MMSLNKIAESMLNSYLLVFESCQIYGPLIKKAIENTCEIRGVKYVLDNLPQKAFDNLKRPDDKQLNISYDFLLWVIRGEDLKGYSPEMIVKKVGRLSGRL